MTALSGSSFDYNAEYNAEYNAGLMRYNSEKFTQYDGTNTGRISLDCADSSHLFHGNQCREYRTHPNPDEIKQKHSEWL